MSSDLVEGTQNVLSISRDSLGLWVQKGIDSIVNDDATGITDLDNLDDLPRKRRFGEQQLQRMWCLTCSLETEHAAAGDRHKHNTLPAPCITRNPLAGCGVPAASS